MTSRQMLKLLVVLSFPDLILNFQPIVLSDGKTLSHRDITQKAILRKTAEVCRDVAASEGRDFSLTIDDNLSVDKVHAACSSAGTSSSRLSSIRFQASIISIYLINAHVDIVYALSARHHFDDETFQEGRNLITTGLYAVKANVKLENFIVGIGILGTILHTLQDFYSHSNWVELGRTVPYSALIRPDQPLQNLAGPTTPTCRNCVGSDCTDNILPEVLQQGLLTSGYFNPYSSSKPAGKCSHGGSFDRTSRRDPVGGINKDDSGSNHASLHQKAADLAVSATAELLQDIRLAVGDKTFLRFMGLSFSSVLCFVIDTTGSMSDDIEAVKLVTFDIIDKRRGTEQEPSAYILVPFNDPDFGPVFWTTDADVFKARISKLSTSGEGDEPEMCLSGLQLALTAAPPFSEIFVFTDAPAKDIVLKNTVTVLIESTKSVVNFMLTKVLAGRQGEIPRDIVPSDLQLYRDLAQASGGQTVEVPKLSLSQATVVIEDLLDDAVVTVFQTEVNPGKPDSFTFTVDGLLGNIIAYITGSSIVSFSITSPTGVTQSSTDPSGPLASITTVGNLYRLNLTAENPTGLWQISVNSASYYSIKVTGQSSVEFIYNLVEVYLGAQGDFSLKKGRPLPGSNVSLLVSVTGSDQVNVSEVTLFDSAGPTKLNGSLQSFGSGSFLVTFNGIPAGDFVVSLKGQETSSTSKSSPLTLQRQASTKLRTSGISVTATVDNTNIEPGSTISVPFTVSTNNNSTTESFRVRADNDRNYTSDSPSNFTVEAGSGGTANGTVTLTVPKEAASGTDVTLTIEVENQPATDINYSVLKFSVTAKVAGSVCQVVNISDVCPSSASLCASSQWVFIANITNGINGTGIESINVTQGNGTLNTSTVAGAGGQNITLVTYTAPCCSPTVELTVVDNIGNVGTCVGQVRVSNTAGGHTMSTSNLKTLLISVLVFFLWR